MNGKIIFISNSKNYYFLFIELSIGKALLLLSEEGFKQRAMRSGDVLHKALQKHHALIKSVTPQSTKKFILKIC